MNTSRFLLRNIARQNTAALSKRPLSISSRALLKNERDDTNASPQRIHSNAEDYRKTQIDRPLNPHMTNTNSAIQNEKEMPSVGADRPPPEFISKVDGNYAPKDSHPENTERMTGGTQPGSGEGGPEKVSQSQSTPPSAGEGGEWGVGEMEGATFRIAPIKRTGEDVPTIRARLLCSYFLCIMLSRRYLLTSCFQ